jgi:hypothetical protein
LLAQEAGQAAQEVSMRLLKALLPQLVEHSHHLTVLEILDIQLLVVEALPTMVSQALAAKV